MALHLKPQPLPAKEGLFAPLPAGKGPEMGSSVLFLRVGSANLQQLNPGGLAFLKDTISTLTPGLHPKNRIRHKCDSTRHKHGNLRHKCDTAPPGLAPNFVMLTGRFASRCRTASDIVGALQITQSLKTMKKSVKTLAQVSFKKVQTPAAVQGGRRMLD